MRVKAGVKANSGGPPGGSRPPKLSGSGPDSGLGPESFGRKPPQIFGKFNAREIQFSGDSRDRSRSDRRAGPEILGPNPPSEAAAAAADPAAAPPQLPGATPGLKSTLRGRVCESLNSAASIEFRIFHHARAPTLKWRTRRLMARQSMRDERYGIASIASSIVPYL